MESDIARILTALVLALSGYFWWRSLRQRDPEAARRYALGVPALAISVIAIAVLVALAMPDGGGAGAAMAIMSMLLLSASAVSAFLLWGAPQANRGGLSAPVLKRAMLLFAFAGVITFGLMSYG